MAIDGIYVINNSLQWYAINDKVFYGCYKGSGVVEEMYKISVVGGSVFMDESYTHCIIHQKWNADYALLDENIIYYGIEDSCNFLMENLRESYSDTMFDFQRFNVDAVFLQKAQTNDSETP